MWPHLCALEWRQIGDVAAQITGNSIFVQQLQLHRKHPVTTCDKHSIKDPDFWSSVRGIHRSTVDSSHRGSVMRQTFPCHDVFMLWGLWPYLWGLACGRILKDPRYWPSVRGIHRSPVDSPHRGPVMRLAFPRHAIIILWGMWPYLWGLACGLDSALSGVLPMFRHGRPQPRQTHIHHILTHWWHGGQVSSKSCLILNNVGFPALASVKWPCLFLIPPVSGIGEWHFCVASHWSVLQLTHKTEHVGISCDCYRCEEPCVF